MGSATRILVATDFSEGAAYALRSARVLAKGLDAPVEILHVAEPAGGGEWTPDEEAAEWLDALQLDAGGLEIRRGLPWVEVARHAEERKATFIVIGSHGTSGYQPLTLGSTATRLAVGSPAPLIVVNPRAGRGSAPRRR